MSKRAGDIFQVLKIRCKHQDFFFKQQSSGADENHCLRSQPAVNIILHENSYRIIYFTTHMKRIMKMAIFCGSKAGHNELYAKHAKELADVLADLEIELIYGGGRKGLMGMVADTMMQRGGTV